jgi:tetratricopeptide (TPR) repeat protein
MLKPKKKIRKHDLKEDKFVKAALQAKTYFDENYRQVTFVVGAIFAAIVIFIIYNYVSKQKRDEANAQLGIAQIEFSNSNYLKASQRLLRLIEDYSGTDEAIQGMFLLANIYYQQGEYADARHYFEEFVDDYSGSNILLASGCAGLAACLEMNKEYEKAAELYQKAADLAGDFPESDNYTYLAGICYKKIGKNDQAKNQFQKIIQNSDTGSRVKDAELELVLLKNSE